MFADQCTANLSQWQARCKELENSTQVDCGSPRTTSLRHPNDFMSAFPLTLPPSHRSLSEDPILVYPTVSLYSQSSDSSSESNPCSPSDSVSSFLFSPTSDSSSSNFSAPPLSASSISSKGHVNEHIGPPNGHAAIRAAGKLGVRKQRSINRNSWSPFSTSTQSRPVTVLAPVGVTPSAVGPAKTVADAILVQEPMKLETTKLANL